ncbi:hypothetical protein HETIRDRAFT_413702 [Heterobasidion irregulare TC 32-1]|uniref:Uncharacterized protein n=1 Tax=Heterobasidion irregulare (strain TC 32-1) TaxID=747525 RepID=W4KNX2_HETIT|nr:uncharacterized protein HETIRDRAFT_413702 [Heterobasidion irregulare TC 32-1]ETW87394.1 hypothetical protein HETIRDRAFT_413702 [Heterobasidion irregulare TC 32-1]
MAHSEEDRSRGGDRGPGGGPCLLCSPAAARQTGPLPPSTPTQHASTAQTRPSPRVPAHTSTPMADDTRSRARKIHRPIFIVANPGSGEDDDGEQAQAYAPRAQKHPYNPQPSPTLTSPPPDRAIHPSASSSSHRDPGPLTTTNLPSHSRHHPASRSNPTLSSPSGTSSPPPTTPGQSAPPGDLVADAAARHDFAPSYSTDALHQQHSSHSISNKSTFLDKMKANIHHPFAHGRRLSSSSRPTTSPTTSTSDTYATRFPNDSSRSSPLDKVLIFVTGDSDQYYTVDITGFRHGAFIKELVFSKVRRLSSSSRPASRPARLG